MKITRESLIVGAKKAQGLTVVIDVFRAFTTAAYVLSNGAKKIIPIGDLDKAFQLKGGNPEFILMGERKGIMVEGFDYGNSPYLIKDIDFSNKTVIMSTESGIQGIVNTKNATEIIAGNFVCVNAIINYIKKLNPEVVTLVAMGEPGKKRDDEDEMCAQYIEDSLNGKSTNFENILTHLRNYKSAEKFFDKNQPEFPEGDFFCATDIDKFDFVLKVNDCLEIVKG